MRTSMTRVRLCSILVGLVLGLWVVYGCRRAEARPLPAELTLVELWQDADSARFAFRVTGPAPNDSTAPVVGYRYRLIRVDVTPVDTLARLESDRATDTLAIAWPTPGDTVMLRGCVRSLDAAGRESDPPECTPADFPFGVDLLPPLSPDLLEVEQLDTLSLGVRALEVRPSVVAFAPGATWQLCGMMTLTNDSTGWTNGRHAQLTPADSTTCQLTYERWLAEVQG